jgi:mono/diheme cytochrome c family protein
MSPQFTSTLGYIFVVLAIIQVWLMLEVTGRQKPKFNPAVLSRIHRINGWLFVAIYLIMLFIMVRKIVQTNAPLDAKSIVHWVLAISLLPLLLVKILIVRFYPKAFNHVLPMGVSILVITLAFVSITGGYYFIKSATGKYISSINPAAGHLDVDIGRELVIQKCNKCHDLTRVFTMVKTSEGWVETVNRMQMRDPTWLSQDQVEQIVFFLSERQNINKPEQVTSVQAETMLLTKCSKCHNLDRAFNKRRTEHEWKILVKRMSVRHRSWINDAEAQLIGDYLAKIYGTKAEVTPAVATTVRPATPPQPKPMDFKPLFQANGCIFCHGEDGTGQAPGTPDWTDPEWQQSRTDEQLTATITNGKDNRMPKFGTTLTEEEIRAAVQFVRSFEEK